MAKKHGHHGGAWKVAYADFVTAMMALFLVLWLTAQDVKIKQAVERAFTHPFSTLTKESTGIIDNPNTQAVKGQDPKGVDMAAAVELNMLRQINEDLMKTLNATNPDDNQPEPLKMELTSEGLRISVFDRSKRSIFNADTAVFTDYGKWVFSTMAWGLARYTNTFLIEMEGHTELGFQSKNEDFSKWELTTARANAARRLVQEHGVSETQIQKVAGMGDRSPLADRPPTDEANRRVTVMIKPRSGGKRAQIE